MSMFSEIIGICRIIRKVDKFLHEERSLDPLTRMAVGHYQFEAIHPFMDGNGRTGCILSGLFLCDIGVLEQHLIGRDKLFLNRKMLDLLVSKQHGFESL